MREFRASLPMALLRAREAVMGEFRPNLAENGINEQQWRVLRALGSADDEEIAVGELAERTLLLGPSLSRILVKLEAQELIQRRTDTDDARRSHISITRAGLALVRRVAPQSEQIYAGIEARFGRTRLAELLAELSELAEQEESWQHAAQRAAADQRSRQDAPKRRGGR